MTIQEHSQQVIYFIQTCLCDLHAGKTDSLSLWEKHFTRFGSHLEALTQEEKILLLPQLRLLTALVHLVIEQIKNTSTQLSKEIVNIDKTTHSLTCYSNINHLVQ